MKLITLRARVYQTNSDGSMDKLFYDDKAEDKAVKAAKEMMKETSPLYIEVIKKMVWRE